MDEFSKLLKLPPVMQTPLRQLNATLAVLNNKTEEIEELKAQLAEKDEDIKALIERIEKLEASNALLTEYQESEDNAAEKRWQTEASWLQEKDALVAEIAQLKLSKEDVAEIRKLCEDVKLGDRYGSADMNIIMVDTPPL